VTRYIHHAHDGSDPLLCGVPYTAVERGADGRQFLAGDRWWPTAAPPTPLGGRETSHDPFMCQRPLVLSERAEHVKQEFA